MNNMEPAWLIEARRHIGLHEIKGPRHAPEILAMWKAIKRGGIRDDETPWCAAFVGACLEAAGIVSTRFESAKSYEGWGVKLATPRVGCIVVFSRDGGGHVGFVVGQDKDGNLLVLGGNQKDAVNIKPFAMARVTACRWPVGVPCPPASIPLPIGAGGALSNNEQ